MITQVSILYQLGYSLDGQCVQTSSGALPASYPMGTKGSFLKGRMAQTRSWSLTSI